MKSEDACRSARDRLFPGDTRAPHRTLRDGHILRLAQEDARVHHSALETARVPRCAPNDTNVPRLVRVRTRDSLTAKDVSLEAHTAADTRCTSCPLKN